MSKYRHINFDDPEQHAIFRGLYDINTMIKIILDYDIPPYEAFDVLIQCFTKENVETNLEVLRNDLPVRFYEFLRDNIIIFKWDSFYSSIELPLLAHIDKDGEVDPKYIEGVEVLKKYFSANADKGVEEE